MACAGEFAKDLVRLHLNAAGVAKAVLLLVWAVLVSANLPWKRAAPACERAADTLTSKAVNEAEHAARRELEKAAANSEQRTARMPGNA